MDYNKLMQDPDFRRYLKIAMKDLLSSDADLRSHAKDLVSNQIVSISRNYAENIYMDTLRDKIGQKLENRNVNINQIAEKAAYQLLSYKFSLNPEEFKEAKDKAIEQIIIEHFSGKNTPKGMTATVIKDSMNRLMKENLKRIIDQL